MYQMYTIGLMCRSHIRKTIDA